MYTDEVDLRHDVVMFTFYASKKYLLPGLTSLCTEYLAKNIEAENVCLILEESLMFHDEELSERCMSLIKRQTNSALASSGFLDISQSTLSKILDSDHFTLKEIGVFNACINWAKEKCKSLKLEPSGENVRKMLGDCIHKIRFLTIDIEDLGSTVCLSEVLESQEEIEIMRYVASKGKSPAPAGCNVETRYKSRPHVVLVEENDVLRLVNQQFGTTIFHVNITCSSEVKVHSFIVGLSSKVKYESLSLGMTVYHSTKLNIVKFLNNSNEWEKINGMQDEELVSSKSIGKWKLSDDLILKKGETKLQFHYRNVTQREAPVYLIGCNRYTMSNERLNAEVTTEQNASPLFGFTFSVCH